MPYTPSAHTPYQWSNAPATNTPLDKSHLEAAETDLVGYVQAALQGLDTYLEGTLAQGFAPTTVKTSAYTAAPNDFVPVNASGGILTITLPNAPADKTRIAIKIVIQAAVPNAVTVTRSGTDVFNKVGGSTTITLAAQFQSIILQYFAASGIWYVQSTDSPLGVPSGAAQLDTTGKVPYSQLPSSGGGAPNSSWAPTNAIENVSRVRNVFTDQAALVSARLQLFGGAVIPANKTINNITFFSGSQAAVTPTHQWFCLVDQARNLLAVTVNDTSVAWGALAFKTLALSATYTPSVNAPVYIGCCVVAGTVPNLYGLGLSSSFTGVAPVVTGASTTGLTTPASLTTPVTAPTADGNLAYAYLT